jgi:hypothetical protein
MGGLHIFGYIRPFKPEMKIKDFETYRAVYCGLCKSLGKKYGISARFVLNYDLTMLAVLRLSLDDYNPAIVKEGCMFNPLKKKPTCIKNEHINFCADVLMMLAYYKLKDDLSDNKFFKKLLLMPLYPFLAFAYKKAAKLQPQINKCILEYISSQNKLESNQCSNLDEACEPTAILLSQLASFNATDYKQRRILDRLGYCLGKWIYLIDAYDDFEKDLKENGYNPLIVKFLVKSENNEAIKKAYNEAEITLTTSINEAIAAFELLEIKRFKEILGNLFYLGMINTQKGISEGKIKNERSI